MEETQADSLYLFVWGNNLPALYYKQEDFSRGLAESNDNPLQCHELRWGQCYRQQKDAPPDTSTPGQSISSIMPGLKMELEAQ